MRPIIIRIIKFQMLSKATNTRRGVVFSTLSALSIAQDIDIFCDAKVKRGFKALFHVVDLSDGSGNTVRTLNVSDGTPGDVLTFKFVDNCVDGVVFRTFGPIEFNINGAI